MAGTRADGQDWVRPIGRGDDGSLLPLNYRLPDGTDARVLDLLRVDLRSPRPAPHQPENWLIGPGHWQLLERPAPHALVVAALRENLVQGPDLLGGTGDRVPYVTFRQQPATASLALILPSSFAWEIREPAPGKRHTRAAFRLGEVDYNLSVTDPLMEYQLLRCGPGRHPLSAAGAGPDDRPLLTISLGEPYAADGCCYKLVATVVALSPAFIQELGG